MWLHLFTTLPSNILTNFEYLKADFTGFHISLNFFLNFVLGNFISAVFLTLALLIGKNIKKLLFMNNNLNYLTDFALGSIFIGTGVAILGFFSLINRLSLSVYILFLFLISFYQVDLNYFRNVKKDFFADINILKRKKLVFIWVLLFILLATVNLINPEIREDQYHVDLPKMYLAQKTIMIPSKEQIHVSASPLLSEMTYMLGIFVWSEESTRYIHFLFYLFVLLTLLQFSKIKGYEFSIFTPLLFVSAPVVLHETSSMYVDFQWIFYFLLAILSVIKQKDILTSNIFLTGILLGAMVSSKLWTIVFIPVIVVFLFIAERDSGIKKILKYFIILAAGTLLISFIWFLRAYILMGNPFYPAFANQQVLGEPAFKVPITRLITLNTFLINPFNSLNIVSPLFFAGIFLFLYKFENNLKMIKNRMFLLLGLTLLLYLSINYPYGRYLLGLYVLFIFFSSVGIANTYKFLSVRLLLNTVLFLIFGYYFINSVMVLPYAIGIDNKNNYLTRILSRDNSSYYNFDNKFNKFINKKDYVATYGIFGYYYADFKYTDVDYVFNEEGESFNLLKEKGVTKLFIKGGDINYFCSVLKLKNCTPDKYTYLSGFMGTQPYYLYGIK